MAGQEFRIHNKFSISTSFQQYTNY